VSLDYCADQFVLKIADPRQIAAVSVDADKEFSYMRSAAAEHAKVRMTVEDVLALKPDLVVRTYGGGPLAGDLLQRSGVRVVQVPFAQSLADVRGGIAMVADALGQSARGEAIMAAFDRRLAALSVVSSPAHRRSALYLTPSGYTTGPGGLIDHMLTAAGLETIERRPGWRPAPLEVLLRTPPDVIVMAFFNQTFIQQDQWSLTRHPVLQRMVQSRPIAELNGAWTACSGWFLMDAIEAMAAVAHAPAP
jgi:iron complex transport system substrate-binding protein